jgi:hypothetical protein
MKKQENYKNYLTTLDYSVSFSEDNKRIIFICAKNHTNDLTLTTFSNLKSKTIKNNTSLCTDCRIENKNIQDMISLQSQSKHKIISYTSKDIISFECCNCHYIGKSNRGSLLKSSHCKNCNNSQFRKDYDEIIKEIKDFGLTLLTPKEEYKNNKSISVLCSCGNEWNCSLNDIKRNRKCLNCKTERTYATNNIKYGVNNVFENEDIKKKSRETCLRNIGVEYAQQNNKSFEKMLSSSFRRREYILKDGTISMILGYEDLAIKELEDSKLYKIIETGNSNNIPSFWYNDDNGKKRKYYPDIFLPEINTIIEVKSVYYFEKEMKINICKAKEVSKKYRCLFYVYKNRRKSKIVYKLLNDKFVVESIVV